MRSNEIICFTGENEFGKQTTTDLLKLNLIDKDKIS